MERRDKNKEGRREEETLVDKERYQEETIDAHVWS